MSNTPRIRETYEITGTVQGVGFRPAVFRLAAEAGLAGWIQNRAGSVRLVLEGPERDVAEFVHGLPTRLPAHARIDALRRVDRRAVSGPARLRRFVIRESGTGERPRVSIPADLAMCAACAREILDPRDRRFGHAFATCTDCGPRYTVLNAMPYDRAQTTMSVFAMCPACRAEYEDPQSRRFHAETVACPACGPRLVLRDFEGVESNEEALPAARQALASGRIVAVRGIGGYLLAADAFNRDTLSTLRERKNRPHKPFAVMARDLATAKKFCHAPDAAVELLSSPRAPIVILYAKSAPVEARALPVDLINPDAPTLGVMLPYSPLHRLLFDPLPGDPVPAFEVLIMTSGNRRGEPICISNEEAHTRLRGIADLLLCHDREVNLRNDDSLCVLQGGRPQVWRRARGFAPDPIVLARPLARRVLAMGAELKNAVAVGFEDRVVLSPHVGDLQDPEAVRGLERVARCLPRFLEQEPECIGVDAHPDMRATRTGERLAGEWGVPVVRVQHHHAHGIACLAEYGLESGLVLAFDGTGLGADESIWGAELLEVNTAGFRRLGTFRGVPLPGGDAAVRRPARQLVARFADAGIALPARLLDRLQVSEQEAEVWARQCARHTHAPFSHAAGRLFDAFSALLGFAPLTVTYEGQAPVRLEAAARAVRRRAVPELPFESAEENGMLVVDWRPAFRKLADPGETRGRETEWAMSVHAAVARAARTMVEYGFTRSASRVVALSGGVFMNRILNDLVVAGLEELNARPLVHRQTPPNDGCIAFGQAVIAGTA